MKERDKVSVTIDTIPSLNGNNGFLDLAFRIETLGEDEFRCIETIRISEMLQINQTQVDLYKAIKAVALSRTAFKNLVGHKENG